MYRLLTKIIDRLADWIRELLPLAIGDLLSSEDRLQHLRLLYIGDPVLSQMLYGLHPLLEDSAHISLTALITMLVLVTQFVAVNQSCSCLLQQWIGP